MGQLIEIHQKRFFTLDEAKELLPIVRRITQASYSEVKQLSAQLVYIKENERRTEIERQVQSRFQKWNQKLSTLGCHAKGMWLVDFDSGEGYYCWHFPEKVIEYFHGYFDGFRGRTRIH